MNFAIFAHISETIRATTLKFGMEVPQGWPVMQNSVELIMECSLLGAPGAACHAPVAGPDVRPSVRPWGRPWGLILG